MSARVVYNSRTRRHLIEVTFDAEEAESVAHALGLDDLGARDLLDAANRARDMDAEETR